MEVRQVFILETLELTLVIFQYFHRFIPPESFFDTIPSGVGFQYKDFKEKINCKCGSGFPDKSFCQVPFHQSPILTFAKDITEKVMKSPRNSEK